MILLLPNGKILSRCGHVAFQRKGMEALKTWSQGEKLPPPTTNDFIWFRTVCDGCKMVPLVGQRYHCSTCGNYDLCSACEKTGHEHPLQLLPQPDEDQYERIQKSIFLYFVKDILSIKDLSNFVHIFNT